MKTHYTTRNHPRSGDTYAVEIAEDGTIVRAAGPLYYEEPVSPENLREWIFIHWDTAADDGAWLEKEIYG